jgi:hypothetical protein
MSLRNPLAALIALCLVGLAMTYDPCERADGTLMEVCRG